jgi:hypothetical protein
MLSDLAHLAYSAYCSLVLGMILGSVKGAFLERGSAVDGRVTGGTDLKLGKLVKFNLYGVVRIALALSLGLLGL